MHVGKYKLDENRTATTVACRKTQIKRHVGEITKSDYTKYSRFGLVRNTLDDKFQKLPQMSKSFIRTVINNGNGQ